MRLPEPSVYHRNLKYEHRNVVTVDFGEYCISLYHPYSVDFDHGEQIIASTDSVLGIAVEGLRKHLDMHRLTVGPFSLTALLRNPGEYPLDDVHNVVVHSLKQAGHRVIISLV